MTSSVLSAATTIMCSTCDCNQDASEVNPIAARDPEPEVKNCRRCGSEPFIILDKIHIECKSCFLESCNKKLRSTIGKSKLMKNNDPVLIAYSGSASSTALMDLIRNSIEFNFRREQKFRPSILHVDMQSISSPNQDRSQRLTQLDTFLDTTKSAYPQWPLYWTTIEMITREQSCDSDPFYIKYDGKLTEMPGPRDLFDPLALNCLRTAMLDLELTDKLHYLRKSTNDLIAQVAASINHAAASPTDRFRCIFVASSSTQLANNLLVDVILGEGATCHSTVGICDTRSATPIVRPMRDFSMKEIAFYLRARKLDYNCRRNLATLTDRKASIQKLTESFLSKLSVDFPSTYSTLLRTGNKLRDS